MEELLKHRSFVEIAHLKETLGSDHYQQFKQANAEHIFTEVHPIVSDDIDATVIDFSFDDTKLSEEDQKRYQNALRALVIPATAGSPIDFSHRDAIDPFVATMRKSGKARISKSEVSDLAQEAGVDEDIALHMAGAFNARLMALARPSALVSLLLENPKDLVDVMVPVDGEKTLLPVNLEYVQKYLREAHIIGVRQKISSATLDRSIMSTSFFDLEKIYTKKSLEARRTELAQQMGGLATALHEKALVQNSVLSNLLSNAYVKPAQLVEGAKTVEGYKQLLESDAGNWEGFTLGEHTETVLRNFDENYADSLPVELLAPMRLAILIHDLGKPMAVANGEKHKQEEYNVSQAEDFLNKIGAYDELKDLLLAVIGKGHNLAFQIDIRKSGESAQQQFNALALESMRKYLGTEHVEEEYLTGFTQMCRILQICDGGAYTSMAITNRGKGKGHYRNAPSFNDSFAQPVGLGRRAIRLRKDGEAPAANNQTPEYSRATSRLHINRSGAGRIVPDLTK